MSSPSAGKQRPRAGNINQQSLHWKITAPLCTAIPPGSELAASVHLQLLSPPQLVNPAVTFLTCLFSVLFFVFFFLTVSFYNCDCWCFVGFFFFPLLCCYLLEPSGHELGNAFAGVCPGLPHTSSHRGWCASVWHLLIAAV